MAKRVRDWVKIAGELRDGFLVMAAICYFFGYIVWAINAYHYDLGLLPALDFQYFVAGAPPVLIILGLYYIFIGVKRLQEMARDWIGTTPTGGKLYLRWAMIGLGAVAFTMIYVSTTDWFRAAVPNLTHSSWFVLSLSLIIAVSSLFFPAPDKSPAKPRQAETDKERVSKRAAGAFREGVLELGSSLTGFLRVIGRVYAGLVFLLLAFMAFAYFWELYQKTPQEFGGPRPQYACLDVVKAQISNETMAGLLPVDANKSSETVMRSLKVEVLFSGGDVMVVRSQGKVYRIAKSTVQAVTACN